MHVLLEEIKKKITQGRRIPSEFYNEVGKSLNLALSKLEMSGEQGTIMQVAHYTVTNQRI